MREKWFIEWAHKYTRHYCRDESKREDASFGLQPLKCLADGSAEIDSFGYYPKRPTEDKRRPEPAKREAGH